MKDKFVRFKYADLTRVLKDGHYWYKLVIDGDIFWCQTYSHAIQVLLVILTRDCIPYKLKWK